MDDNGRKEKLTAEPGRAVKSTAGRDCGSVYIVTGVIDKDFINCADGRTRTLKKPKKKRVKHVKPLPEYCEAIAGKLKSGARVFDSEIRSAVKKLEAREKEIKPDEGETKQCRKTITSKRKA